MNIMSRDNDFDHLAPPGASLIGLIISIFLMGIITVQTIKYFETFPKDKLVNWIAVKFLFVLNVVAVACMSNALYDYLISPGFQNPHVLRTVNWKFLFPAVANVMGGFVVLMALTFPIYSLSKCHLATWGMRLLILVRTGFGMAKIHIMYTTMHHGVSEWHFGWSFITASIISVVTDTLICGTLCLVLLSARTGNPTGDTAIVRMFRYMVPSCLLLVSWELAYAISVWTGSTFGALCIGVPFGPVFNLIFLAMLHARSKLTYSKPEPTNGHWQAAGRVFSAIKKPPPTYGGYSVSIARETVHQTCDHGAQELKLMTRLEARFPEEIEVQSYYAEETDRAILSSTPEFPPALPAPTEQSSTRPFESPSESLLPLSSPTSHLLSLPSTSTSHPTSSLSPHVSTLASSSTPYSSPYSYEPPPPSRGKTPSLRLPS